MTAYTYERKNGFTLVEITIVIIILGLLISGVAAGVALVERSKIQSVITEFDQISTSVQAFAATHNSALPGDMINAGSFMHGTIANNCPGGNGDGTIDITPISVDSTTLIESMCAWAHLAGGNFLSGDLNAGYTGSYTDTSTRVNDNLKIPDIPSSKMTPATYFFVPYQGVNYIMLGAPHDGGTGLLGSKGAPAISQKHAHMISSKVAIVDGSVFPLDRSHTIVAINADGSSTGDCHDGVSFKDSSNDIDKVCILIKSLD